MRMNFSKRLYNILAMLAIVGAMSISGCKKTSVTHENFEASNVAVLDFWNDGEDISLDFSLDQSKKLHTGQLTFSRNLDYLVVNSGKRTARFGNSADSAPVYTTDINLVNKKVYSLFLTGTKAQPESVFVEDDIASQVPVDQYKLRVANMNTDASGSYNIVVVPLDAPLSGASIFESAVAYKTVTTFKEFNEESGARYDIWAVNPGVDTLVARNILLVGERSYTIALSGQKNTPYGSQIALITNLLRY